MKLNFEDIAASHQARVEHIVEHLRRVLVKYPAATVPPELQWILKRDLALHSMLSRNRSQLLVIAESPYTTTVRTSIPAALLNSPEQDIHAWARSSYWAGRRRRDAELRAAAAKELARLEQAARDATRKYEDARKRAER